MCRHIEDFMVVNRRHAQMMPQWAGALLAGSARQRFLHMNGSRMPRFCPADMCGAEKRDNRAVERVREVSRSTIGGD